MNSSLACGYRLTALDMRGHGLSDKPTNGYNDSKLWGAVHTCWPHYPILKVPIHCAEIAVCDNFARHRSAAPRMSTLAQTRCHVLC
jgi:pimeloyl-ACP methyl ester carboxylesterase